MRAFPTPEPLNVDAYQAGHFEMIPPGMSDFECSQAIFRKPIQKDEYRLISAGMTPFIKLEMEKPITKHDIDEAEWFYQDFYAPGTKYPWPKSMFEYIVDKFGGIMPLCITGLPDGQAHYVGEPHAQVFTDVLGCGELVGWIESTMLPYLWVMSVVATRGRIRKEKMMGVFHKCYPSKKDDELHQMIAYKFHDFGRRGAANAQMTGIAHLMNWLGTDTMDAAYAATKYLNGGEKFGACSIAAAAHRSITPWPHEMEAYERMVNKFKGNFFSVVADSYNYTNGMKMLASFADVVKGAGGFLVGRPDSGDPTKCIIEGLEILASKFGLAGTNAIGGRIVQNAGIIQGDGVKDEQIFGEIYPAIINAGWCPSNVAFGMGEHNHKAVRSETEEGYKTCAVAEGNGLYRPVMKGSESRFKRSLPGPVKINTNIYWPRVKPISVKELLAGDMGDYVVHFDGRKGGFKPFSETFEKTRERTYHSWNQLEPEEYDSFDYRIRENQEVYMKTRNKEAAGIVK